MNKITRSLLSGVSLAALASFALPDAVRAGVSITSANHGGNPHSGGYTNVATTSFIEVTTNAIIAGDVINAGNITDNNYNDGALDIDGHVTGKVSNTAKAYITGKNGNHEIGIDIEGTVNEIVANHGHITITDLSNTGELVAGIAVHSGGEAKNGVNNNGYINLSGRAHGGADVFGTAVGIYVDPPGKLTTNIHNSGGSMNVYQRADHAGTADAFAGGIYVNASTSLNAHITNKATLNIQAQADHAGLAIASAVGIEAFGTNDVHATITNAGVLNIGAHASRAGTADAHAVGIDVHGGSNVTETILNKAGGTINANATASRAGDANAYAWGIYVIGGQGNGNVTNNAAINAHASAHNAGSGYANAIGIFMDPDGTYTVHNHGSMQITATAHNIGGGLAHARATGIGVYASLKLDAHIFNDANMTVNAYANHARTADATAIGLIVGAETAGCASVNGQIFNSGNLDVNAYANHAGNAHALAAGLEVTGAQTYAEIRNKTTGCGASCGQLNIYAHASRAGNATATAYGLYEKLGKGHGIATNQGNVDVFAQANNAGHGYAHAAGIFVDPVGTATAKNHGHMNVTAWVYNVGNGTARATGVGAFASGGAHDFASATNDGHLNVYANATADNHVNASALGIGAYARGALALPGNVTAMAHNSGTAQATAFAHNGTVDHAYATGIRAAASDAKGDAHAVASNGLNGHLEVVARASEGFGSEITLQDAHTGLARATGIGAFAGYADGNVAATAINNGNVDHIQALASGTNHAAATARGLRAFAGYASGDAHANATNNGQIWVTARVDLDPLGSYGCATARAVGASAGAAFVGCGVNHETASANAINHGNMHVLATVDPGATANAYATGLAGYASFAYNANAKASNTGNLHVQASATATKFAYAHALGAGAFAGIATNQAHAQAFNNGDLTVVASAYASPAGGDAHAVASGLHASAIDVGHGASAKATNAGNLVANATARGYHSATASAFGAIAHAGCVVVSGDAFAGVKNTGHMDVHAVASTANLIVGHAHALGVGLSGFAGFAEGNATVHATNGNGAVLEVSAFAHGTTNANASAAGINGVAIFADTNAHASAHNNGVMDINAHAIVEGPFDNAAAGAVGIVEFAGFASNAKAFAHNSISGNMVVTASATANGVGGDAFAQAGGIAVAAMFAKHAQATVTNDGDILVNANANANFGSTAFALGVGIAGAAMFASQAEVHVINGGGHLTVNADAFGCGEGCRTCVDPAIAVADGILEVAAFAKTAVITASNDSNGVINVHAHASAGKSGTQIAVAGGIFENAFFVGNASITGHNTGYIGVNATATNNLNHASAASNAYALAGGMAGLGFALVSANVSEFNGGNLQVNARATAFNHATASAYGMYANAFALLGNATAKVTNTSVLHVHASATYATHANARAYGAWALADPLGYAKATAKNSGPMDVTAYAHALGVSGSAHAGALGLAATAVFGNLGDTAHVTNAGNLHVHATAIALYANATATAGAAGMIGVAQHAQSGDVSVHMLNAANLTVNASAQAFKTATAHAIGMGGFANHAEGNAVAHLVNGNSANVNVHAFAGGGSTFTGIATTYVAASYASAFASGLVARATHVGGNVSATVVNQGHLHVWDTAAAAFGALAVANGVKATASHDGGFPTARVTNQGGIDVTAFALGFAPSTAAKASAYAQGIAAHAGHAGNSALAVVNNSAELFVEASAWAFATAFASAGGISAVAGHDGGNAEVIVNNYHDVTVEAHAFGQSGPSGFFGASTAVAHANGIFASAGHAALSADVDIFLDPNVKVTAAAWGYNLASAKASGVVALAGNVGGNDYIDITNDGGITVSALASATGPVGLAHAQATGVHASAYDADNAYNFMHNNGHVDVKALALGEVAIASAFGVSQFASASISFSARNYLSVTSNASINVKAIAVGTDFAGASAGGVHQLAIGFTEEARDTFINHGDLTVRAHAVDARARGPIAVAQIPGGIFQLAYEEDWYAQADILNSNNVHINATATATGESISIFLPAPALAIAAVGLAETTLGGFTSRTSRGAYLGGIAQNVAATGVFLGNGTFVPNDPNQWAYATLSNVNNGVIEIGARASANARTWAVAEALIGDGIIQNAIGTGPAHDKIYNNGNIDIVASAYANASKAILTSYAGYASAFAEIGRGIEQFASGDVYARMTNYGDVNIHAGAHAHGTGIAIADALIGAGIAQTALGDATYADATLYNYGGKITVGASAHAGGGSFALAEAGILNGIGQFAVGGYLDDTARIYNTGSIWITANAAVATKSGAADAGLALAGAEIGAGIDQFASDGYYGFAEITNYDAINIFARAYAAGTSFASANAAIGIGIEQNAVGAYRAEAYLYNGSAINIAAIATARNDAVAIAHIGTGIEQSASVTYTEYEATAIIQNHGGMHITALANATATGGGSAHASAGIGNGINQVANEATYNLAQVNNTATLAINADANANGGVGVAIAFATIADNGIYQFAEDGYQAHAYLTNAEGASIFIDVAAKATGLSAAFAEAHIGLGGNGSAAIHQTASDAEYAVARVLNGTNGQIDIGAYALAQAKSALAVANATVNIGIYQYANATYDAQANVQNHGNINIDAMAVAVGGPSGTFASVADAFASVSYGLLQTATNAEFGYATFDNYNHYVVDAYARASGDAAKASALAWGVTQEVAATYSGNAYISNDGYFGVFATAIAKGDATANAYANGIYQEVHGGGNYADADVYNYKTMVVGALASAAGSFAFGNATAHGVSQEAHARTYSDNDFYNGNVAIFDVHANANALGGTSAAANAYAQGVKQEAGAGGSANANVWNDAGWFFVNANGFASGNHAQAFASAQGVDQHAGAGNYAAAYFFNSGVFVVNGNAIADGDAFGSAVAFAGGVKQWAGAGGQAKATASNDEGFFNVNAHAYASGSSAYARANAYGVDQRAGAGSSATDTFFNDATFHVGAKATANGGAGNVTAYATATGVSQYLPGGGKANFANWSDFSVRATASANATPSAYFKGAFAYANGEYVHGNGNIAVDIYNDGVFHVQANAFGDNSAFAAGVSVVDNGHVSGFITNSHVMHVTANAAGGNAFAGGIGVFANTFTGHISNYGNLTVVANGSTARAVGIAVGTDSHGAHGAGVTGYILNDGGRIAAIANGGLGTAIDVASDPNPMEIDLEGDAAGHVYGDIVLSPNDWDVVNVKNGETFFDGGINPATHSGVKLAYITSRTDATYLADGHYYGNLNVGGSTAGTLDFVRDANNQTNAVGNSEGQSYAFVHNFVQNHNGTLILTVDPTPDSNFVYVHAINASIAGTVQLNLDYGIYGDQTIYRVVYDNGPGASRIFGHWDNVVTNPSPLMFLHAHEVDVENAIAPYDEADIALDRTPFDDTGVTPSLITHPNEEAVADGIENSYHTLSLGPQTPHTYGALVNALLFLPPDEVLYQHILDELSGEEIGQTVWADLMASEVLRDAVGAHLQATMGGGTRMSQLPSSIAPAAGSNMGKGAVWGGAYGKWNKADTLSPGPGNTYEAPGFSSSEEGFVGGGDMPVDPNTTIGIAGAWTGHGSLDFNNGNSGRYNGFELGAYARYNDPDNAFYLQALGSYGWYSNETHRFVSVPGFDSGWIHGSFDSHVWQLYGEGGVHVDTGSNLDLVPYVALDYLSGDSNSYDETGLPGANLHVNNAKSTSFSSFLGAKVSFLNMDMSGTTLVPTLKLAWQHEFEHNFWEVNANFLGVPSSAFVVTGRGLSRDSLVAGAEVAMSFSDNVDAVLDWDGRFASNHTSNTVLGRLNFKF